MGPLRPGGTASATASASWNRVCGPSRAARGAGDPGDPGAPPNPSVARVPSGHQRHGVRSRAGTRCPLRRLVSGGIRRQGPRSIFRACRPRWRHLHAPHRVPFSVRRCRRCTDPLSASEGQVHPDPGSAWGVLLRTYVSPQEGPKPPVRGTRKVARRTGKRVKWAPSPPPRWPPRAAPGGSMASTIQMERPWVPTTRSLSRGWITRSSNGGPWGSRRRRFIRNQFPPPVHPRPKTPTSFPRKRRFSTRGLSRTTVDGVVRQAPGDPPPGRPEVLRDEDVTAPDRCPIINISFFSFKVAVEGEVGPAVRVGRSLHPAHVSPSREPGHVLHQRSSRSLRRPGSPARSRSSVPTHTMSALRGDSSMVVMVP